MIKNKNKESESAKGRLYENCYLSASKSSEIGPLLDLIEKKNITVVSDIRNSDFVIAVISQHNNNENLYYEIGYTKGLNKIILLLISPDVKSVPFALNEFFIIRAKPNEIYKIEFALDQLLSKGSKKVSTNPRIDDVSEPLGNEANEILNKIPAALSDFSEHKMLELVKDLLRKSNISIIEQPMDKRFRPDLVFWLDSNIGWLQNPIIIELNRGYESNDRPNIDKTDKMFRCMSEVNANFAMVIYFEGRVPDSECEYWAKCNDNINKFEHKLIWNLKFNNLVEKLRSQSLGEVIQEIWQSYLRHRNH